MTEEIKNDSCANEAEAVEVEATVIEDETEAGEGETSPETQAEAPAEDAQAEDADTEAAKPVDETDWKDKYLRLHADWDNYRRRMDEQRADERVRATENLMRDLIPLIDDMKHALDWAQKNGAAELSEGFSAIDTKFRAALEKHGLQEIDPAGEPFDPLVHQAVSTVPDESVFDETVRDVYQKGYKLGVKVIRPAMVTITTGGEKRPSETNEEQNEEETQEEK
ncbi:MAG: nucleotide exchange factor GrpE [Phoenicibacter congonensis]|uniref:Protein GrpE n=1 Tax=Phoenicibacter congonensis TaxID=1944646 RepID=A0AA43UAZ1_9ACTN|nr:nucleotide exchange factor GrpE [Phoenicibacter congonensis]